MPDRFSEFQLTSEALQVIHDHGINSVEELAEANVTELQHAFVAAARAGTFPGKYPSLVKVAAWVEQARKLAATQPQDQLDTDLANIPTAVVRRDKKRAYAGSGRLNPQIRLVETKAQRWDVRDPEEAAVLKVTPRPAEASELVLEELNPESERELHARRRAQPLLKPTRPAATEPAPEDDPEAASAFRTFDDYKEGRVAVRPLDRRSFRVGEDRSRSTDQEQDYFEAEQEDKKHMSRWHVRGVQFPNPFRAYFGAFLTVEALFFILATAVMFFVTPLYLDGQRLYIIVPFAGALLFGLAYLLFAVATRCRVCSCPLFFSRRCLKNAKAHRLLGGLPMLAQSLHILLFRWFRCMYCGTAIRLKRGEE